MQWHEILIFILIFEVILFALLIIALFILRVYENYKQKKQREDERAISKIILGTLQGKSVDWKKDLEKYQGSLALVKVLEAYSRRFSGEEWRVLQEEIAIRFLLTKARKIWKSPSWIKRNGAARAFSLCPLKVDEEKLLILLEDPVFLVRSCSAEALMKMGSKKGLEKMIVGMSSEKGYGSDYYQDLVQKYETPQISRWIQEMAAEDRGKAFHLSALNLMARKMQTLTYPYLMRDIASQDPDIRFAAVCVFTFNPQKGSEEVIFDCIQDPDERVRKVGFEGAAHFLSKRTLEMLEKGLNDPVWIVRRAAALSLKRMGSAGKEILKRQAHENKEAHEIAQYILQFDAWF